MAPSPEPSPVTASRPGRRRQRSVRVTVAIVLMAVATAAVVAALPTQSPLWLSAASVLSLACGWASARIVYSELTQSRREAAIDRAAQAQAYRTMFVERAGEHAEFTTAMTDRLAARDREVGELGAAVVAAEQRAMEAENRVQRESRRVTEAQERVAALQQRVETLEVEIAEKSDELATWEGAGLFDGESMDTAGSLVDLMVWEEKVTVGGPSEQAEKHA